ncbi:MAG TPA: fumarylacetoacetate hydrolase family protein [Polyangium sp.]|nr:fumarylacetoacetate hydrolase family protein [Polyangium sp.]
MRLAFASSTLSTVPIVGHDERFPVHRIYCVARNHADHAQEMGHSGLEEPFYCMKPGDSEAVVVVEMGQTASIRYPSLTQRLHHEVELVIAIGTKGQNIAEKEALRHVFGYAVGLDMTRQDLLNEMMRQGRPWCIGKSFDQAAVIGPICPAERVPNIEQADIFLQVNGVERQRSNVSRLIWNIAKTISEISRASTLYPGDLIYTGTPRGVGPVVPGDSLDCGVTGLESLCVHVLEGAGASV